MKSVILDTNVVLRFVLADHPTHSPKAKKLFELAESGSIRLHLSHVNLAELVWTLTSFFEFSRERVGATLKGLVLHEGVCMDEPETALLALERFANVNVDYPDCYTAALALTRGQCVASYYRDFRKFKDIDWKTPEQVIEGEE